MRRLVEAGQEKRTFYVQQYDGVWKLNRAELRGVLEGIISGEGYELLGPSDFNIDLNLLDMDPQEAAKAMETLLGIKVEVPEEPGA